MSCARTRHCDKYYLKIFHYKLLAKKNLVLIRPRWKCLNKLLLSFEENFNMFVQLSEWLFSSLFLVEAFVSALNIISIRLYFVKGGGPCLFVRTKPGFFVPFPEEETRPPPLPSARTLCSQLKRIPLVIMFSWKFSQNFSFTYISFLLFAVI